MSDRYTQLVNLPVGKVVADAVGLPVPTPLERHAPGDPVLSGRALLGGAPGGRLLEAAARAMALAQVDTATELRDDLREAVAAADLDAAIYAPGAASPQRFKALVFDATAILGPEGLDALWAFFHPAIRTLLPSGRVVVLGTPPEGCAAVGEATAQRALEGFTRSLGKEVRAGATVQLVYVARGQEHQLDATLRFFLSPRSAYVSGQVVRVGRGGGKAPRGFDPGQPLAGRRALVTGASRGIGAAIAEVLARDGAHVVGLDVPQLGADLRAVTEALGGTAIELDVTAADAPAQLVAALGGEAVDLVVHNAGVTRDKTVAGMREEQWDLVLDVNLVAPVRLTDALLEAELLGKGASVVAVSSMNGIAGAKGQTNYAASKAGLIGWVQASAPVLAKRGVTINAVAPGFIETQMTAAMPIGPREAGRRMNSLSQGGLPVDVAETIAWLGQPASAGVTGQVVRVCGQSLLGA
jgi:3-oxoacyl-[acyl-carrier protein] reductase